MKQTGLTPLQERTAHRLAMREALLKELHRPASPCGDIQARIAEAEQRLKRPKVEKDEYTPPKPADHVTAFLVSPTPKPIVKEQRTAKHRKHVAAHTKATCKAWGKAGHALSNKILRSKAAAQKFQDDLNYAN